MPKDNFELSVLEQYLMLAAMRLNPDAYGISMRQWVLENAGKEYSVGSIYAALDRLEERGLVKSRAGEASPERGGKRKLHFVLTGNGQIALDVAMNNWDAIRASAGWKGAPA